MGGDKGEGDLMNSHSSPLTLTFSHPPEAEREGIFLGKTYLYNLLFT
jgi:hypothetical protein